MVYHLTDSVYDNWMYIILKMCSLCCGEML